MFCFVFFAYILLQLSHTAQEDHFWPPHISMDATDRILAVWAGRHTVYHLSDCNRGPMSDKGSRQPSASPLTFSACYVTTPLPSISLECSVWLMFLSLNEVVTVDFCQWDSVADKAGVDTR